MERRMVFVRNFETATRFEPFGNDGIAGKNAAGSYVLVRSARVFSIDSAVRFVYGRNLRNRVNRSFRVWRKSRNLFKAIII